MPDHPVSLRDPGGPQAGMPCPVCRVDLVMADKQGVEIDYCPKCRGIWLDRGEIDKIVERSLDREAPRAAPCPEPPAPQGYPPQGYPAAQGWHGGSHGGGHGSSHGDRYGSSGYDRHRRRSWLGDLFD